MSRRRKPRGDGFLVSFGRKSGPGQRGRMAAPSGESFAWGLKYVIIYYGSYVIQRMALSSKAMADDKSCLHRSMPLRREMIRSGTSGNDKVLDPDPTSEGGLLG